jgi:hypothetical protein
MIFARALWGQELILLGAISLAMALIYLYLRWRGRLGLLRRVWPPALLWAIFGTLDALVSIVGTWGDPWSEANPTVRAWLHWDGWVGQVIYTFLYVLFWAAIVIGLEWPRARLGGVWAHLLGAAQLLILYTLAVEHFFGFLSWTPYIQPIEPLIAMLEARAPWLFSGPPVLSFVLNYGTVLGSLCVALHLAITTLLRRMGGRAHMANQARPGAA